MLCACFCRSAFWSLLGFVRSIVVKSTVWIKRRIASRHVVRIGWWHHQFSHEFGCGAFQNDARQIESHKPGARRRVATPSGFDYGLGVQGMSLDRPAFWHSSRYRDVHGIVFIDVVSFRLQLSVMEVELNSALEERNRARNDASESSLAQDDVVAQAREDRDTAITRRTKAEIELAKTRVELMQANSQLLEAIHQKVELSQQLEQWQVSESNQLCRSHPVERRRSNTFLTQCTAIFSIRFVRTDGHARTDRRSDEKTTGRQSSEGQKANHYHSSTEKNLLTSIDGTVSTIEISSRRSLIIYWGRENLFIVFVNIVSEKIRKKFNLI